MWQGEVVAIFIAPTAGAPMVPLREVRAVPGQGLEGDRYFLQTGYYSNRPGPHREVTLIEEETLTALARESGLHLASLGDTRRNIVTRGVPLNHLVERSFRIGEVVLRGIRLCEPCAYLEGLTGLPGLQQALVHRGGLRAQVLQGGLIRVGDPVQEA